MNRPILTLKPLVFIDSSGNEFVNPKSPGITSYITAQGFRNAMRESTLPKEFVDWFIKDPYNGRARFVTHYKKALYDNYKLYADYVSYKDPAYIALEKAKLCNKSCLAKMDVSSGTKAKAYLLLMGAEIEANYTRFLFSQRYPGSFLNVTIEEPYKILVKGEVKFLHPASNPSPVFGPKLF